MKPCPCGPCKKPQRPQCRADCKELADWYAYLDDIKRRIRADKKAYDDWQSVMYTPRRNKK